MRNSCEGVEDGQTIGWFAAGCRHWPSCGRGCREICQQRWLTQFGSPTAMLSVTPLSLPHMNQRQASMSMRVPDHPGGKIAKISSTRGRKIGRTIDMGHTMSPPLSKISRPQVVASGRSSTIAARRRRRETRMSGRKSGTTPSSRRPARTGVSRPCWISPAAFTLLQVAGLLATQRGTAAG